MTSERSVAHAGFFKKKFFYSIRLCIAWVGCVRIISAGHCCDWHNLCAGQHSLLFCCCCCCWLVHLVIVAGAEGERVVGGGVTLQHCCDIWLVSPVFLCTAETPGLCASMWQCDLFPPPLGVIALLLKCQHTILKFVTCAETSCSESWQP